MSSAKYWMGCLPRIRYSNGWKSSRKNDKMSIQAAKNIHCSAVLKTRQIDSFSERINKSKKLIDDVFGKSTYLKNATINAQEKDWVQIAKLQILSQKLCPRCKKVLGKGFDRRVRNKVREMTSLNKFTLNDDLQFKGVAAKNNEPPASQKVKGVKDPIIIDLERGQCDDNVVPRASLRGPVVKTYDHGFKDPNIQTEYNNFDSGEFIGTVEEINSGKSAKRRRRPPITDLDFEKITRSLSATVGPIPKVDSIDNDICGGEKVVTDIPNAIVQCLPKTDLKEVKESTRLLGSLYNVDTEESNKNWNDKSSKSLTKRDKMEDKLIMETETESNHAKKPESLLTPPDIIKKDCLVSTTYRFPPWPNQTPGPSRGKFS